VPAAPSVSVVVGTDDWLAGRLLEQRMVALSGALDADDVNRAVAELALPTRPATSRSSCGSPA
jgi:ATP-dependent Clp protease protease subunit